MFLRFLYVCIDYGIGGDDDAVVFGFSDDDNDMDHKIGDDDDMDNRIRGDDDDLFHGTVARLSDQIAVFRSSVASFTASKGSR